MVLGAMQEIGEAEGLVIIKIATFQIWKAFCLKLNSAIQRIPVH